MPKPRAQPTGYRMIKYAWQWPPLETLLAVDARMLQQLPDHVKEAWTTFCIERKMCRLWCDKASLKKHQAAGLDHLGFQEHFKRMVSVVLDRPAVEEKFRWKWTPYSETMLDDIATMEDDWRTGVSNEKPFYAMAGHGSSGKSKFQAVWGLFKFLLSPGDTTVFLTSTTKDEARKRIWGDVAQGYWKWFCKFFLDIRALIPGNLVESVEKIQHVDGGKKSDLNGLFLIPGERGKEEVSGWVGFKNTNVILCADEFPMLSPKIDTAAQGNLKTNKGFQMIVTGNLVDPNDPMGQFCDPVDGWESIKLDGTGMVRTERDGYVMLGWKTKRGFCRWFSGDRCPNVIEGREKYPGLLDLPTVEGWKRALADGRLDTYEFYRQYWSFPSPEGKVNSIFSTVEFVNAGERVTNWRDQPTPISFLDASFSHDGDAAAAAFGFCGYAWTNDGRLVCVVVVHEIVVLSEGLDRSIDPATGKERDPIPQIAAKYAWEIRHRGIQAKHAGCDDAGGGSSFGSMLAGGHISDSDRASFEGIGAEFCRVNFNGEIPDVPISEMDKRPAKERYDRLVSYLWFNTKDLVRAGQLKGVPGKAQKEFCTRTYKNFGRGMVKIQKKAEMTSSPNHADCVVGLTEVARRNFDLVPSIQMGATKKEDPEDDFLKWATEMGSLHTENLTYA